MHDLATAKIWQTAFEKDFRGMAQGCNKAGQKGTNGMFVITHYEIHHNLAVKKFFTYTNPVSSIYPHRIRITAGGNLLTYDGDASVCTADLDTEKLHWKRRLPPGGTYILSTYAFTSRYSWRGQSSIIIQWHWC